MLFNTFQYFAFFLITILIYFIIPPKIRTVWLLIVSYFFYGSWNIKYTLLMLLITLVSYLAGILISNGYRFGLWVGVSILVIVLMVFKYLGFLLRSVNTLVNVLGVNVGEVELIDIVLPVGISFYVFQAISYMIDVYRDDRCLERNFIRYALYISFFPQLVAGPIERSDKIIGQIKNIEVGKVGFEYNRVINGLQLIVYGLFLKMVIADRLAVLVDKVFVGYNNLSSLSLVAGMIGFSIQIYCDFAGYSLIACGSALVIGIELMENFRVPYFSQSVSEFWRRVVTFYATILFYSVTIFIVFLIMNGGVIDIKTLLSVFPIVCGRSNWYVTVYFVVLLISPVLNLIVKYLDMNIYKRMLVIVFILFSVVPSCFFWIDQFDLHDGYSILWYCYLYLVAAYIKKYGIRLRNGVLYLMMASILLLPISKFAVNYIVSMTKNSMLVSAESALYCYNAFPVFLSSLAIFVMVTNKDGGFKKNRIDSVILYFGKTSFAVFYIHSFVLIRDKLWVFMGSEQYIDSVFQVIHGIICAVIVYLVCSLIETIRLLLFKYIRIDYICEKIYTRLDDTIPLKSKEM